MARARRPLEEVLLEMGAIDPLQLKAAKGYAQQWDLDLGRALVERRFCSKGDVTRAWSLITGHPVIDLDPVRVDRALADLMPLRTAEQYGVVPLRLGGTRYEVLELAAAPPADLQVIDAVLAVTKKRRAVVHLAHEDEVARVRNVLYGLVPAPSAPKVQAPVRSVAIERENEFALELETQPEGLEPRPVLLYGWHDAALKALTLMIERGGVDVKAIDDDELDRVQPDDVVISSTLGLRAVLPAAARLKAKLIICGAREDLDAQEARAVGARVYLLPPLSTEQICRAVKALRAKI